MISLNLYTVVSLEVSVANISTPNKPLGLIINEAILLFSPNRIPTQLNLKILLLCAPLQLLQMYVCRYTKYYIQV